MPPNTASRNTNTTQHHATQPNSALAHASYSADYPELPTPVSENNNDLFADCSGFEQDLFTSYPFPSITNEIENDPLSRLAPYGDTSIKPTSAYSPQISTFSKSRTAPYDCRRPGCYRQFGRGPNRHRHEQDFHSDAKPYQCHAHVPGREKRYKVKKALVDHLEQSHGIGRMTGYNMVSTSTCITEWDLQARPI